MTLQLPVGDVDAYLWQVFVEGLEPHAVLELQGLVQLVVPVGLPREHVLWDEALHRGGNNTQLLVI